VPRIYRVLLALGAACGVSACQMATLRGRFCFRYFALYPDFETQLREQLQGDVANLVKPLGWAVLMAAAVAYVCRAIFMCWASKLVKVKYASGQRPKHAGGASSVSARDEAPVLAAMGTGGGAAGGPRPPANKGVCASCACASRGEKPAWEVKYEREKAEEQKRHDAAKPAAPSGKAAAAGGVAVAVAHAVVGGAPAPAVPTQPVDERSNSALASKASKEKPGREHTRASKAEKPHRSRKDGKPADAALVA
jgi:hypothetical protein